MLPVPGDSFGNRRSSVMLQTAREGASELRVRRRKMNDLVW
jgi:hypothetical protein